MIQLRPSQSETTMPSQMLLSAFFFNPQGNHRMAWRHADAPGGEVYGLRYYRELAEEAERAKLDFIFVADHVGVWDSVPSGIPHYANTRLEPITLLSALAAVTNDIGLVATASTSYSEPYNLARFFASLDHISNGRVAWNVVTSAMPEEGRNFGHDGVFSHQERYSRASEFVTVTQALWDSWEDGSIILNKATGEFADPVRVHHLDHDGEFYRVRGPLNVPRPPQGHLPIFQAGSSPDGKAFAARHADVQFVTFKTIEEAQLYRAEIQVALARNNRSLGSLKLLMGVQPVVAASRAEAREKIEHLQSLQPSAVSIDLLSTWVGLDLSGLDPDGPMPSIPVDAAYSGVQTTRERVRHLADQGHSIIEIANRMSTGGEMQFVGGTPLDIADDLEHWFRAGAVEGFNLMFPQLPDDWLAFAREVVPELQRRNLFRREYAPGTLRERLGLERVDNGFALPDRPSQAGAA